MAKGKYVSNKNETIRLFKNPVLEYFSHIHPATPIVVYMPVVLVAAYFGVLSSGLIYFILLFVSGILLWSLTEYSIHRFVFHLHPKSERGKKVHFLVHGIHHDYPRDRTRLVMPLLVSLPLAVVFFLLFRQVFGVYHLSLFSGFVFGYICYDSIHYATHHLPMKNRVAAYLKRYHLLHHYDDENKAYGVSMPLWDFVFGTRPGQPKSLSQLTSIEN